MLMVTQHMAVLLLLPLPDCCIMCACCLPVVAAQVGQQGSRLTVLEERMAVLQQQVAGLPECLREWWDAAIGRLKKKVVNNDFIRCVVQWYSSQE